MSPTDDEKQASEDPYTPPKAPSAQRSAGRAQSIPLLMALVLIAVALLAWEPGLGVVVLLFGVPAYARAVRKLMLRMAAGETISTEDGVLSFFASAAVVLGCGIAGCVSAFVTCTGLALFAGPLDNGFDAKLWTYATLGGLAFLVTAGITYHWCWPDDVRK